ncbi:hypothetical protein [Microbacterium sp. TWP3-1-2b2]|uniref:hypothetical protein n=1 Tax=Microbacterium sp. TWP3-1-2b2 TaxID=2804651 RepID=UPI003CFB68B7
MTGESPQSATGAKSSVKVRAIEHADVADVASFLHRNLNARVAESSWASLMTPPWTSEAPNRGFLMISDGEIVGAYVAVHSDRDVEGATVSVCNLAAFCVLPEFRTHSLRLMRAMLAQKGLVFTDLSPSGAVPAMNERLGFRYLDRATRLVLNAPGFGGGVSVTDAPEELERTLVGADLTLYRDHREAPAARHLLVRTSAGYAYLVYRRDRRKRLPLFMTPLYAGGDREILRRSWPAVAAHLLAKGLPFTLAESHILGFVPGGLGRELKNPRPRMVKGDPAPSDYLYSELALLSW